MRASSWLVIMGALLGFALAQSVSAQAATTAHSNSQQEKMKTCNADATTKGLKGDARQAYMKTCLSKEGMTKEGTAHSNSQQEKMKTCNADAGAKGLKGTERESFMKSCLSAGGK